MSENRAEGQVSPEVLNLSQQAERYYKTRLQKPQFFNLTSQALSQDMNTQVDLVKNAAQMVREKSIRARALQQVVDRLHPGLLPVAKAYATVAMLSDREDDFEAYKITSEIFENETEQFLKRRGF